MSAKHQREFDSFRTLLTRKGLKFTEERRQLLDEVLLLRAHFDADHLYAITKKKGLRVSRDTVYRTLPLLLECGIVQKSVGDGRRDYFERTGAKGHHDHMVCVSCGKIIEFKSDEIETIQDDLCRRQGFKLLFHDHRLFGHCAQCDGVVSVRH